MAEAKAKGDDTILGRLPEYAVDEIKRMLGLGPEQIDTILQLVSLPENGDEQWWTHYNYIEDLDDGRGYTTTLYGACSGTGDLLMIFDVIKRLDSKHSLLKYYPALSKAEGDDTTGLKGLEKDIPALGRDAVWRQAVWEIYVKLYWAFVEEFCKRKGDSSARPGPQLNLPISRGFMLDTAINSGGDYDSMKPILQKMSKTIRDSKDEKKWIAEFMKARRKLLRSGFEDLDTSKTGDRCVLWSQILGEGNVTLDLPIKCYGGYWSEGEPDVVLTETPLDDGGDGPTPKPPKPPPEPKPPPALKIALTISEKEPHWQAWNIVGEVGGRDGALDAIDGGPGSDGWAKVAFPPNCPWGPGSGAFFKAAPGNFKAEAVRLSYEVFFDRRFNWGQGGQLPGLMGGKGDSPGGNWTPNGSSFRVMWGPNGNAFAGVHFEVVDGNTDKLNQAPPFEQISKPPKGEGPCHVWEGQGLAFKRNWNTVRVFWRMNTPGRQDGSIALNVNSRSKTYDRMRWRNNPDFINMVWFQAWLASQGTTAGTIYCRKFVLEAWGVQKK